MVLVLGTLESCRSSLRERFACSSHSRILVAVGHSVAVRVDEHADMDPRSAIGWCYMTCSYDCSAV